MAIPLMPKATAVWLVENTTLTFEQIAEFCHLHILEVQAIADGESSTGMLGFDPLTSGQLTAEEIKRCEADGKQQLILNPPVTADSILGKKSSRYTPVSKRQDRPDAIAWILKYHPEVTDPQICRLLGTTKNMITSVRTKSHWNSANIKPRNPAQLGLCSLAELESVLGSATPTAEEAPAETAAE